MFRESDEVRPLYHSTYTKKQLPLFQKQQQSSKFDEFSDSLTLSLKPGYCLNNPIPETIPSATDTIYDPSHPDADWAGLVPKTHHRRIVQNYSSNQSGLVHTDSGISSTQERDDYGRKRRIHAPGSSNINILGGIPSQDPWKSDYNRFANKEETTIDQYTVIKQQIQRKQSVSEKQGPIQDESYRSNMQVHNESKYIQPRSTYGSHSRLISEDLSLSVLSKLADSSQYESKQLKSRPSKTLIVDNYSSQMPGYTGGRR